MGSKTYHETSGFPAAFPILLIFQSVVACFIMLKDHESLGLITGITVPLILLFIFSRLNVKMHPEYLEYYFFPFMFRRKKILWSEIREVRLINADPIGDFGGWGIRLSRRYGKAFITGGNEVVFLLLKNGKRRAFSMKNRLQVKTFLDAHAIPYGEDMKK